eukprot:365228-Chlamydomonas_euryale.AAC.37
MAPHLRWLPHAGVRRVIPHRQHRQRQQRRRAVLCQDQRCTLLRLRGRRVDRRRRALKATSTGAAAL